MLTQVSTDLWETPTFSPFPGLTTHAYLWTSRPGNNLLFYSPGGSDSLDAVAERGGIAHQYLSHQDEAGDVLKEIAERFGATLHAPAAELDAIGRFTEVQVQLAERHVDDNGVEVIPTPGHSPGSTCFLFTSADGRRYLLTGDTIFRTTDGTWSAGYIPGVSDATALAATLDLLATLEPDVIISSAFQGDSGVTPLADTAWADCVAQARATLPSN
ncbi:metallo-beta-lactamase superfamily protein [Tamaricihabitans halophyticus]|uniref:Metallo-beta-lactamase superfamily protein n=1 Tax=Tamaricihabitans halophyticus TaxID=1262583 RepID=A0A4R2QDR0_9PSEU|nr:MBL fold metallo-hydrolase [Tamaricihabitans halophyticus]TCP45065.1 metallo-beta-lactamase superfamily protein [Tamaricihabitans halophyticus]